MEQLFLGELSQFCAAHARCATGSASARFPTLPSTGRASGTQKQPKIRYNNFDADTSENHARPHIMRPDSPPERPAWTLWIVLKTNPPPRPNISIRSRTCWRISPGVPNGSVFCVSTPPAPECDFVAELILQRPRGHAGRRTLDRIENVEPGFNQVGHQCDDRTAGVNESLPRRMFVDPIVHLTVEWLKQLAIAGRTDERTVLRAEIRARQKRHRHAIADGVIYLRQILQGDVALPGK